MMSASSVRACHHPVEVEIRYDSDAITGRLDIVAGLEVRDRVRPFYRDASLAERGEVIAIGDVVAEIIAHDAAFPREREDRLVRED
jgi:hypothetical protein